MRLALFEPDIPPNTGTMIRLAACLGVPIDIIEPCGFTFSDASLRRAGMDYRERASLRRHASFAAFEAARAAWGARLILLTTRGDSSPARFAFRADDILLVGRESAGVPDHVHALADARLRLPMAAGLRSLNVAVAAAMALYEGLRQTDGFPTGE